MGWIQDLVNNAVKWVVDKVFKPFFNWVSDVINTIVAELKIMRHQLIKDFAKWLDNDFAFLLTVVAAITLGFFWPKIYLYLKDLTEKFMQSAMVEAIKEGILKITDSMIWINIETIHLMLKVFWPQYTDMIGDFSQAVAALADELGEGSGYILAYFQLQSAIAHNTGALLGMPAQATELESYNKIADFTKRIDDRFRRYAYDPGLIYTDFLEEVVIPSSETLKDAQQGLVSEVRENHERNVEMNLAVTNIETAVDDFIEAMPPEIAAQIEKRWSPIRDWMENNYHSLVDEILRIGEGIANALEIRQQRVEEANAYAMAKIEDPLSILMQYELRTSSEQVSMREYMLKLAGGGVSDVLKEVDPLFKFATDQSMAALIDLARSLPAPEVLKYESAPMTALPKGADSNYTDWFVGEY